MTRKLTRKEFFQLSAAATMTSVLAGRSSAAQEAVSEHTSRHRTRTLIRGADVLTMDPTLGERLATDVLIEDGKVAAIGKDLHTTDAEVIDASGMILMPGMIDGHRHVWEFIDLGRLSKFNPSVYAANYMPWKMSAVIAMEPEDHYIAGLVGGLQAIDSGVTSILDYAHGQNSESNAVAAAQGLKDSGISGWFAFQLGVSYPIRLGDTVSKQKMLTNIANARATEEQWRTVARLQKDLFHDSSGKLQLAIAPTMDTGDPIDELKKEWARARSTGVELLAAHMHKPQKPFPAGVMGHRDSGIPDLHEAGVLGPDYHVSHANRLTSDELKMLRDTGGMICATTMGEFPYMMQAFRGPPVHGRARAAGVPVGIGIDVTLALTGDYFEHLRASLWSHYLEEESRELVNDYRSRDTLDFVTGMGAKAIRLGDKTGTITVGKRADLVLLSTDRIGFSMVGSLADRVVTFANTSDIDSVWISGQARKRGGKMLGVNWSELKARYRKSQERVHNKIATVKWI